MGLKEYFKKRSFTDTPEPKGAARKPGKRLTFVVQQHHASRMHYDFRLEIDGVLKSWAVPKGPSLNPADKHLAVHVEDHPFDYRKFEGVIPEGNYGAGNVIIWDEGWFEARMGDPADSEKTLRKELKKGHLTFVMHGKKLKGEFALIKLKHQGDHEDNWLLIKKDDEFASSEDITKQASSVKSGRTVDAPEMGGKQDLHGCPKVSKPWPVKPMLCTLVDEPFSGDEWLFEVKWDGYRAIGTKHNNEVELYSRNATDFKEHYPPVVEALRALKHDVILDGEVVILDEHGKPHFELLQQWRKTPKGSLVYYVFDILWYDGHDVRDMPLRERKALLKTVVPSKSVIRYSDHVEANGLGLFKQMQKQGLEGMVAKKATSQYAENNRGGAWLKIKTHLRQEVVIGGFTEPRGTRTYLGSLLVGVYKKGKLTYVGHSGGGIADNQRQSLYEQLVKLERKTSPFSTQPKPNAPVHWVEPTIVCEMSFSEWTDDGYMRHPRFEGLRADKKPQTVTREAPRSLKAAKEKPMKRPAAATNKLELTHLDKIFFPKHKYTKGDLIEYYKTVAPTILPYLKDRPLSLLRQPDGIKGEAFFQKNLPHLPGWLPSANIYSDSNEHDLHWLVGGTLDGLLYAVQLGSIEINPWNSRVKHLDKPDWVVIDLDPEGVTFEDVITVALTVKEICDEWGIDAYPKTSGKTGIHIFMPAGARYTYEQVKLFAHLLALEVNRRQPKLTSVERMPKKRPNKIYIDFLQNREGQTLAAPYSVRPTPDASVSAPLEWKEVKKGLKPSDFTIQNMPQRIKKVGDLWKPVIGKPINLAALLRRLEKDQS